MKIAIIGVGAMGSLFGSRLAPLADVLLIGHWPQQLATLHAEGLTVVHPDGSQTQHTIRVTDSVAEAGKRELALILVKSYQTARAAGQAGLLLTGNGLALTLQNGFGNLEQLAAVVGPQRATLGVTAQGATMVGPGIVRHAGHGPTYVADLPPASGLLAEVAALFNEASISTEIVGDTRTLMWRKLAINAAINPLTALLNVQNGFLAEDETARQLMVRAAKETAAVARANTIDLTDEAAAEQALAVSRATAGNRSSMLQDVSRGAPTEIEAIAGAVVRLGRERNIATPVNALLLAHVGMLELSGRANGANRQEPAAILQSLTAALQASA